MTIKCNNNLNTLYSGIFKEYLNFNIQIWLTTYCLSESRKNKYCKYNLK